MSNYETKPGRGTLFKATSDKKHDLSGELVTPDGTTLKVVGYVATDRETGEVRKDRNGNTWINLQVFEPDGQRPAPQNTSAYDLDDSVPF